MNSAVANVAIALLCDAKGLIREVVRDNWDLASRVVNGLSLSQLVDEASHQRAEEFLAVLRRQRVAIEWEMCVPVHGERKLLYFAGEPAKGGFLIVGAYSRLNMIHSKEEPVARLKEEPGRGDLDPPGPATDRAEEPAPSAQMLTRRYDHFYEELTRINNELATLHRESARHHVELAVARRKFQVSEQRFSSLSACTPTGNLEMDAAGSCLCSNARWQTITGLRADDSLGNGWQSILDPSDGPAFLKKWASYLATGFEFKAEFRFVTKRAIQGWMQVRSICIRADRHEVIGRISAFQDITERKLLEAEMAELRNKLNREKNL
jgi:PAS domain S-box-containing protein